MARRVTTPKIPRQSGRVRSPDPPPGYVVLSFRYLRTDDGFDLGECEASWFCELLDRLRAVCTMMAADVRAAGGKSLRAHEINWRDTTRPDGFRLKNPDLAELPGYQFQIAKTKGRVHGFWLAEVFNVVWLDPDHRLYP